MLMMQPSWHRTLLIDIASSLSSDAAVSVGLCPSWSKTKVQNLATDPSPLSASIDGQSVEAVNSFIYLGLPATVSLTSAEELVLPAL